MASPGKSSKSPAAPAAPITEGSKTMDIKMWLGDKPWFESVTTWGVIAFTVGQAAVAALGAAGVLSPELQASAVKVVATIGAGLTALGLRRAQGVVKPAVK